MLFQLNQKFDYTENIMNPIVIPSLVCQIDYDMENANDNATQLGQEVENTEIAKEEISCSSHIVKPTIKAKDAIALLSFLSRI